MKLEVQYPGDALKQYLILHVVQWLQFPAVIQSNEEIEKIKSIG
jgi:hypothetical protein